MGYRSDVITGIFATTDEALTGLIAAARIEGIPADTIAEFERCKFADHVFALTYSAQDVKWHDSYADVQAHQRFLDFAEEKGFATSFVRIGEQVDDTEVRHHFADDADAPGYDIFPEEYVGVSRSIYHADPIGESKPAIPAREDAA